MKHPGVGARRTGRSSRGRSLASAQFGLGRSPPRALHPLAWGIERMGLVPLRFPVLAAVVVGLLSIGAAFGVARIKVDDSLSQLFRSETPEFKQYEEVSRRFPSSEFDVLLGIGGTDPPGR